MIQTFEKVPAKAVSLLIEQLAGFGVTISLTGTCEHVSGRAIFHHNGEQLVVQVLEDAGHFPKGLLIGGLRQLVEEAVESVQKEGECLPTDKAAQAAT